MDLSAASALIESLQRYGVTPLQAVLLGAVLYLLRENTNAKKDLAACYVKMNRTLAELPNQIVGMAVKFQEHRSDGINVSGDAVFSGRDTTKSDVSYEPIIPRAVREAEAEHNRHEGHRGDA